MRGKFVDREDGVRIEDDFLFKFLVLIDGL